MEAENDTRVYNLHDRVGNLHDHACELDTVNQNIAALTRQYNECKTRCADIRRVVLKQLTGVTFNEQMPENDEQFCAFVQTSLHTNRAYIDAYSECSILQLRIEHLEMKRRDLMHTM